MITKIPTDNFTSLSSELQKKPLQWFRIHKESPVVLISLCPKIPGCDRPMARDSHANPTRYATPLPKFVIARLQKQPEM